MSGHKPLQASWGSMSLHRPFPLLEWEMAVFGTVVQPFVRPVIQTRRNVSFCSTIRPQLVRDDPLGNEAKTLYQARNNRFAARFSRFGWSISSSTTAC